MFYVSHRTLPQDCTLSQAIVLCESLPHLDCPYGPWLREEWDEISVRMSEKLGLGSVRHCSLPNFRSVISSVGTLSCTVVSDARFGYLHDGPELRSFPLQSSASLCAVSTVKNENPLIGAFCAHMKDCYTDTEE